MPIFSVPGDIDETSTGADKCCTAFKYSFSFVFLIAAFLLVGAFVQFGEIPSTGNGTIIDDLDSLADQIKAKGGRVLLLCTNHKVFYICYTVMILCNNETTKMYLYNNY